MRRVPAGRARPLAEAVTLADARDRRGRSPGWWLAQALRGIAPAIELRQAALGAMLELRIGPGLMARHGSLPLATNSVSGIGLNMCLHSAPGLHGLFAELRRILRPTGIVAALVPVRPARSIAEVRAWRPLHRAVGGRPRSRNESACDNPHWLFAVADFAVLAEQRRTFRLPVPDGETAARVVNGLVTSGVWPADLRPDQLERARQALIGYAMPGRTLPIPLRLLVARR